MRRYARTPVIAFGQQYGTSRAASTIRKAIKENAIRYETITLQQGQRLDTLAGEYYGDGRWWWIIAAASNIGWGLQVPPGTYIVIPNIEDATQIVG